MSVVGPRPIVEEEIPRYGRYYQSYLSGRPGLTGLWQVVGRNQIVAYRRRIAMDIWYIRNGSLALDCLLLIKTVGIVFGGRGI